VAWPRGWWRYLVPNTVTISGLVFAVVAVQRAFDGFPVEAAWWAMLVVLTDKADGFLATRLKATSEFGVQLDSLTDAVAFGVTPATIFWAYFSRHPELGWTDGWQVWVLRVLCACFAVAASLRLARFNVLAQSGPKKHYTGIPTTLTAGFMLAFFVMCLKYSGPSLTGVESTPWLHSWKMFPGLRMDGVVPLLPWMLPLGAAAMLSPIAVPKLGKTFSRVTDVLLLSGVLFGYVCGLLRRLPDYLSIAAAYYICLALYHTAAGRARKPPTSDQRDAA
jgi:CDP-diacylglycerol--serine O-phosphatidyltransferase